MSSKKFILPIAIGAGIYFLATRAANAAQTLGKLSVVGGKIKKLSFKGLFSIDVQVELKVNNPGSISIPLEYYTGTISHAGTKISNFTFNAQQKNVELHARTITPVLFNLSISTISFVTKLANVIKDLAAGNKVDSILQINSSLYAGGFDLPVNFTHDLKPGSVQGIAGVKATLEFKNNSEMEKYFGRRGNDFLFLKN